MPTRPRPLTHRFCQSCPHGISGDASTNPLVLFGTPANPVKRFILPERLSGASQLKIRESCSAALDALRDQRNIGFGRDQQMHMIRHHHIFVKRIPELRSFRASLDGPANFLAFVLAAVRLVKKAGVDP
jgi:hypothetical protein